MKSSFVFTVFFVVIAMVGLSAQEVVWKPKTYGDSTLVQNPERQILKNGFPRIMLESNVLLPNYFGESNNAYTKENFQEIGVDVSVKFPVLFHRLSSKAKAAIFINGTFRHVNFTYLQTPSIRLNFFDRNEFYYSLGYGLIVGPETGFKFMVEPFLGLQSSFRLKTVNVAFDDLAVQDDYFVAEDLSEVVFYKGLSMKFFVSRAPLFDRKHKGLSESIPMAINFGISHQQNPRVFKNDKYKEQPILIDGTLFNYPHQLFYLHFGLTFML